jgi:hypothetical protein
MEPAAGIGFEQGRPDRNAAGPLGFGAFRYEAEILFYTRKGK